MEGFKAFLETSAMLRDTIYEVVKQFFLTNSVWANMEDYEERLDALEAEVDVLKAAKSRRGPSPKGKPVQDDGSEG